MWAMLSAVLFLEIGPGWSQALAVLILSTALIALFSLYLRFDHPDLAQDEDAVAFLGVLIVGSVLGMELWFDAAQHFPWISPFGFPLPLVGLLAAILLHPRLAVISTVVLRWVF